MSANQGHIHRSLTSRAAALAAVMVLAASLSGCGMGKAVTDYVDSKDTGIRKRVAVAPINSAVKEMQPQADALRKSIVDALTRSSGLSVVDIAEVQDDMARIDPSVRNPEERALLAGRRLGLTAIVTGSLVDLSVQYQLKGIYGFRDNKSFLGMETEIKVLNPSSGTVAGQGSFRREQEIDDINAEAIKNGAPPNQALVAKLLDEVTKETLGYLVTTIGSQPWVGTVLEVTGDRVMVNVGTDSGLSVGSRLIVFAVSDRLRTVGGQEIVVPGAAVGRLRLVEMGRNVSWGVSDEGADKKITFEPGQTVRTR